MQPLTKEKPDVQKAFNRCMYVPQGMCGLSNKPDNHIGFMTTTVAPCVALALVGWGDNSQYPLVSFAHLDDVLPGDYQAEYLIDGMQMAPEDLEITAYVVNGDSNRELLDPILDTLKKYRVESHVYVGAMIECLIIDITKGVPVELSPDMVQYVPNARARAAFDRYIFTDRHTGPFRGPSLAPYIECAFHVSSNPMDFYVPEQGVITPAAKLRMK